MYYNSDNLQAHDRGTPLMPPLTKHTMQECALPFAVLEILNNSLLSSVSEILGYSHRRNPLEKISV